jgi:membrane-associated protein
MDTIHHWIDLILHADTSLQMLVTNYQGWTYLILFTIIFCETGLVVTPFLPGDSLLFAAGTIASSLNVLNIYSLVLLIFIAAFAGDNSNYFIGRYTGPKIFSLNLRFIRKDYLFKTHAFYEKYGGRTLVIARFMPIIRTFAPFVAGVGSMRYLRFLLFSVIGNLLWINSFLWAGYLLGTNDFVKKHFTQVTFGIIIVSLLPAIFGALQKLIKRDVPSK